MKGRVRMKDIGAQLGLDKSTVSLALRGDERIAKGTRERVRKQAEAMGYVQDPALSRLAQERWSGKRRAAGVSIGMVNWAEDDYPDQTRQLLKPLRGAVEGLGYGFERIVVEGQGGGVAAARILRARGVRGLVVIASRREAAWQGFAWEGFCGVEILAGGGRASGLATIRQDTIGALLDAGRRIERAGAKSAGIVLLQQPQPSLTDDRDEAAAMLVLKRWAAKGMRVLPLRIVKALEEEIATLAGWLRRERPDCLIYPNSALGYIMSLEKLGIPERTRVIVHRRHGARFFAGYEQPLDDIARMAAQQVDSLIRVGSTGLPLAGATTVVPVRWEDGPSFPNA